MKNKIVNHKRNGMYWFLLSIAVVVMNIIIIYNAAHKSDKIGEVVGNSPGVILFITFISLSYFFRHRPDVHKRLLPFAAISMLGPALARFPERYELLRFATLDMNVIVYGLVVPVALWLSVLVYDLFTLKKPHFITVISISLNVGSIFLFVFLTTSGWGMKYVEFLKSI